MTQCVGWVKGVPEKPADLQPYKITFVAFYSLLNFKIQPVKSVSPDSIHCQEIQESIIPCDWCCRKKK